MPVKCFNEVFQGIQKRISSQKYQLFEFYEIEHCNSRVYNICAIRLAWATDFAKQSYSVFLSFFCTTFVSVEPSPLTLAFGETFRDHISQNVLKTSRFGFLIILVWLIFMFLSFHFFHVYASIDKLRGTPFSSQFVSGYSTMCWTKSISI